MGLMASLLGATLGASLMMGCKSDDQAVETVPPQTPEAPPISVQPMDQTLTVGQTATFGVVASGSGTLSYQWMKNDADISGATSAVYTTPAGARADSGATYSVKVSTSYGSTTSRKALLTVVGAGQVGPFAGSTGVSGSTDATGAGAAFATPMAVVADGSGNLFVADRDNSVIRRITPTGDVTTFAGTAGSTGSADGTGSAARFNHPEGLAIDGSGTLYVSDTGNRTIRKITSAGVVTTLAGTPGGYGNNDATGAAATFAHPQALAVDASGNVYVIDPYSSVLRKVSSAGVVTTLAGEAFKAGNSDGTGTAAHFNAPQGLAISASGELYVADTGSHTLRKVTSAGVVTLFAGTAAARGLKDATGSEARFYEPSGLAFDASGNLWVAELGNRTVRKVTSAQAAATEAGGANPAATQDGTGAAASFRQPAALVVVSGTVYILDSADHIVRKLTPGA